jgi:lipopolysaccharide heptosyltransferase I
MNILIVKLSSIGDIVHTLPALALIKRSLPQARVSWVVEAAMAELLRDNPLIDDLITLDTRGWRKQLHRLSAWQEMAARLSALRRGRYDVGLDFQGLLKSGLVLYLSGARRRVGFESAALKEKASRIFLTDQARVLHRDHVIERNLEVVRSLIGPVPSAYEFPLGVTEQDRAFVEKRLTELGVGDFAILNPGGGWPAKRWPPACYGELADFLRTRYQLTSLVTYGPGDKPMAIDVAEAAKLSSAIPVQCTLKQLAALSDHARLFVGGDTGPMHIAAARRTPIVALYGPTSARRNGPFAPEDQVIEMVPPTGYRYYSRRNRDGRMLLIPVDDVKRAVERRLSQHTPVRTGM